MTTQQRNTHKPLNAVDQIEEEANELNTFYLDFGGDTRVTDRSDAPDAGTDRIALKATTLAEAKLEAMELVRQNPHLRHLEIFQGDERISSCERPKNRDWADWKEHNQPVEIDDQPHENDFEKLENLARNECNRAGALIDIKSEEPERYRKRLFSFGNAKVLNPAHKEWRVKQAELQSQMHDARDVFNSQKEGFTQENNPTLNDEIDENESVKPLAATDAERAADGQQFGPKLHKKEGEKVCRFSSPKHRFAG